MRVLRVLQNKPHDRLRARQRVVVVHTTVALDAFHAEITRYMAPEVAQALPSNESADCYSFAMVMWEMVSLELPFQFCGVNQMTEQ